MPNIVRFGPFELNLETADLKGIGPGTRLPEQQFQILRMLLLSEGGVVSRDEIRRRLWPGDTVVEFDGSINAAILKLRSALRAESNQDGFIDTWRVAVIGSWSRSKMGPRVMAQLLNHSAESQPKAKLCKTCFPSCPTQPNPPSDPLCTNSLTLPFGLQRSCALSTLSAPFTATLGQPKSV